MQIVHSDFHTHVSVCMSTCSLHTHIPKIYIWFNSHGLCFLVLWLPWFRVNDISFYLLRPWTFAAKRTIIFISLDVFFFLVDSCCCWRTATVQMKRKDKNKPWIRWRAKVLELWRKSECCSIVRAYFGVFLFSSCVRNFSAVLYMGVCRVCVHVNVVSFSLSLCVFNGPILMRISFFRHIIFFFQFLFCFCRLFTLTYSLERYNRIYLSINIFRVSIYGVSCMLNSHWMCQPKIHMTNHLNACIVFVTMIFFSGYQT